MFFRMIYKSGQIFLPFCHNSSVWRTDRQRDRQTDGETEFSSQYRVCITCSAVIKSSPVNIILRWQSSIKRSFLWQHCFECSGKRDILKMISWNLLEELIYPLPSVLFLFLPFLSFPLFFSASNWPLEIKDVATGEKHLQPPHTFSGL